ncbi:MAG: hypothetical protein ABSF98_11680 [Bryobacteraceae bacterium]
MMMTISFCLIGMSRKLRMSGSCTVVLFSDRSRYIQQPGAELEPGVIRRGLIDVEPHPAVFNNEGDHAAVADKTLPFADGQNSRPQSGEDSEAVFSRIANKEHLARLRRRCPLHSLDRYLSAAHNFSRHNLIQRAPERVISQNADGHRRIRRAECRRRPFDEFGEVQQEYRLDLVLEGVISRPDGKRPDRADPDRQARHHRGITQQLARLGFHRWNPSRITCSMSVWRTRFS